MPEDLARPGPGDVSAYCEPIYRYCVKRLGHTETAEDLAQEILAEAIEGLGRRPVRNLDAWIWTVARNRFRRLFMAPRLDVDAVVHDLQDGHAAEPSVEQALVLMAEKERAFRALIGIAETYRRVLVAFYVHGDSYEQIARELSLPVSSVKWRIHEGRKRLRERWDSMEEGNRIYDRIEWWVACNGSMNPYRYLSRQICRAVTAAAYERPLSVEEIGQVTGIPAVYIEDELEALLHGEALQQVGSKYATGFIIFRLADHRRMIERFHPLATDLAKAVLSALRWHEDGIRAIGFYGSEFPFERLLRTLVPRLIRSASGTARRDVPGLKQEDFPKRLDGGHGWFVVSEGSMADYGDVGGRNTHDLADGAGFLHYYWIARYFSGHLHNTLGTIGRQARPGAIRADGSVDASGHEPLAAALLESGLAETRNGTVRLVVPVLTTAQNQALDSILDEAAQPIVPTMRDLVSGTFDEYRRFTPDRLHGQIPGVIGSYLHNAVGLVVGRLEEQGEMLMPAPEQSVIHSVVVELDESMA